MVGLWDSVTGFFSDLGDFFSGKDFFEAAGYAWNDMMKLAADVLTKNPSSGTYKDVWENISTIYTTLNVVAVSLLCIFFLYGFCRDSCDLHADLTFERTIKMFIRLIITSNVMSMALSYMPKFFTCLTGSVLTLLMALEIIAPLIEKYEMVKGIIFILSTVCIWCFAPVNHPNLALSKCEQQEYKMWSRKVLGMEFGVIVIAYLLHMRWQQYMMLAIVFCAVFILIAKIVRQEVKCDEK